MMKISKVLVVINRGKSHVETTAQRLRDILDKYAVEQEWVDAVHVKRGSFKHLGDLHRCKADLALVCGGDGTLIQTAHRLRGSGVPL